MAFVFVKYWLTIRERVVFQSPLVGSWHLYEVRTNTIRQGPFVSIPFSRVMAFVFRGPKKTPRFIRRVSIPFSRVMAFVCRHMFSKSDIKELFQSPLVGSWHLYSVVILSSDAMVNTGVSIPFSRVMAFVWDVSNVTDMHGMFVSIPFSRVMAFI